MNTDEIFSKIFNTVPLTDELFRKEVDREDREEGLYASDLSGIVGVFGRDGFYKIVRYCRENGLRPIFKAMPHANDGGTLTFEEQ
jgi:hypothetical protein